MPTILHRWSLIVLLLILILVDQEGGGISPSPKQHQEVQFSNKLPACERSPNYMVPKAWHTMASLIMCSQEYSLQYHFKQYTRKGDQSQFVAQNKIRATRRPVNLVVVYLESNNKINRPSRQ